jgi:hypothetical protein
MTSINNIGSSEKYDCWSVDLLNNSFPEIYFVKKVLKLTIIYGNFLMFLVLLIFYFILKIPNLSIKLAQKNAEYDNLPSNYDLPPLKKSDQEPIGNQTYSQTYSKFE